MNDACLRFGRSRRNNHHPNTNDIDACMHLCMNTNRPTDLNRCEIKESPFLLLATGSQTMCMGKASIPIGQESYETMKRLLQNCTYTDAPKSQSPSQASLLL
mmetsp:Transcript_1455/g.3753  ORF Transcript_1455/g.3753 Transcript_1455/m.3753 type:complete len:102 (-) Transcript_1455:324-629(-)